MDMRDDDNNKRSSLRLVFLIIVLITLPIPVLAQCTGASGFPDPLCGAEVPQLVNRLITAVFSLVGALFFIMFLWGGFQWMIAGGDAAKVKSARTILMNAVIGLAVVALSYTLVSAVISILQSGSSYTPPSGQPAGPPAVPEPKEE